MEYILIEQDYCEIEVFRHSRYWQSGSYFLGDNIEFESLDIEINLEDIYFHIENDDMTTFLREQASI